ncbi:MAG TPA: hypothetical protein VE088_09515 [Gaiellaceae bacterium]|jgi:hypothetical protein|nr:hypothetical protein [Gaiellaceae bacterium]
MGKQRALKTAALSEVNGHILRAARDSVTQEQEWEFLCECGRPNCHEHVMLTIDAYSGLHDGGGAVLAPGHRVSHVARAWRLVTDAEALVRQARQQIRRAKRTRPMSE